MRQQFNWFFAAVFIALFSTFSLVAHSHAHDVNQSVDAPTEIHTPALANNKGVVPLLAQLDNSLENGCLQIENLPEQHVGSVWFARLYRALAQVEIVYEQNLNIQFIQQQSVAARISELTLLSLAIPAFLPSDRSATHNSF